MGKIKVGTTNIGGTQKASAELTRGAVNIIRGTSSSGKSSLMRGVHLGLVGGPEKHRDEIERLRLNDTKSDAALLRRGSDKGSVSISYDDKSIEATIPKTGYVSGTGSNEKAVYTTMLSSLPSTSLHEAVFNESTDNPNDFRWVSEVVSEAKDLLVWQNVLNPLEQEIIATRARFQQWKDSKGDSDSRKAEIDAALGLINAEEKKLTAAAGAEEAKIGEKLATARTQLQTHTAEYNRLATEVESMKAQNAQQLRRIAAAESDAKIAKRRLNEANDLMDMELIEPNVPKLDAAIAKATEELRAVEGEAHPSTVRIIDAYITVINSGEAVPKKLEDTIKQEQANLGDKSKVGAALENLKQAKSKKDSEVRKFMEARSKQGSAAQQAAAARSSIKSAEATIADANKNMSIDSGSMSEKEKDLAKSKNQYEASAKEVQELQSKAGSGDSPEMKKLSEQRAALELERDNLESSSTFELRITALQMMPNETIRISESQGDELLGDGSSSTIHKNLVSSNLNDISTPDVRSLIKAEIDNGILADIDATTKWVSETIENQLQQTRRIFNDVGTSLFTTLSSSPISGVELDTDYQLRVKWKDGSTTGLTGAGGERTIIAAALLIAMRKAFTPDIPILMFDGMLENLDPGSRTSFLDFLKSYAATEDIAVFVSLFDEKKNTAEVSVM
jgi:hypothetical protein